MGNRMRRSDAPTDDPPTGEFGEKCLANDRSPASIARNSDQKAPNEKPVFRAAKLFMAQDLIPAELNRPNAAHRDPKRGHLKKPAWAIVGS